MTDLDSMQRAEYLSFKTLNEKNYGLRFSSRAEIWSENGPAVSGLPFSLYWLLKQFNREIMAAD